MILCLQPRAPTPIDIQCESPRGMPIVKFLEFFHPCNDSLVLRGWTDVTDAGIIDITKG